MFSFGNKNFLPWLRLLYHACVIKPYHVRPILTPNHSCCNCTSCSVSHRFFFFCFFFILFFLPSFLSGESTRALKLRTHCPGRLLLTGPTQLGQNVAMHGIDATRSRSQPARPKAKGYLPVWGPSGDWEEARPAARLWVGQWPCKNQHPASLPVKPQRTVKIASTILHSHPIGNHTSADREKKKQSAEVRARLFSPTMSSLFFATPAGGPLAWV